MSKNVLGKRIQQIRKSKNLTQFQLAEIAGINEKHISKIETGVYFPTYSTLDKILKALNLKLEDVGLGIAVENTNTFYTLALEILNSAESEKEHEVYYNILKEAKKGIDFFKKK